MEVFDSINTDWVGYLVMAVVLISFLMKDVVKLRTINSIGALLFVAYGLMMEPTSIPIIVTNAAIFCIHLYYLVKKKWYFHDGKTTFYKRMVLKGKL